MIGFSIFLLTANFFQFQFTIYRRDIAERFRENVAEYLQAIISSSVTCSAERTEYEVNLRNKTAGYRIQVGLDEDGLLVATIPGNEYYSAKLFNLGKVFELSGQAFSGKPIKITVSKTQNKIEVLQ